MPGDILQLGDVGWLKNGQFRKQTDLDSLGVRLEVETGVRQPYLGLSSVEQQASDGSGSAKIAGLSQAGLSVKFAQAGAVVFEASGIQHKRIRNALEVDRHVVNLAKMKAWEPGFRFIDQIWHARYATIVIAATDDAAVLFSAEAAISGLEALSDPKLHLRVTSQAGDVVRADRARDLVPLYTCRRLNFWRTKVKPASTDVSNDDEPSVGSTRLEELLDSWND